MAATIQGWGGPALLESYQIERQPVHKYVIDEAVANHAVLGNQLRRNEIEQPGPEGERVRREIGDLIRSSKEREFHALGVVKGYRYEDSPIIVSDGKPLPALDWREYRPSAHPGRIAPHAWLADGSSLYDHFGSGYTLLYDGDRDDALAGNFAAAAHARKLPLAVLPAPDPHAIAQYEAKYTLVRPDQHVAWRGDRCDDPGALLERLCGGNLNA